jgi:RND family efflux transporter MFP subunit
MRQTPVIRHWRSALTVLVLLLLIACASEEGNETDEFEATPVIVERARADTVVETERSIARSEAFSAPVVATQVDGQVTEIIHDIGDHVSTGTPLATVDDTTLQLNLASAQAEVAALQARLEHAEREFKRLQQVAEGQHVSESELEMARTELAANQEEVKAAEGRRDVARRNVRKTKIRAPIDGRIEARLISEGDYLAAGSEAFHMVPDRSSRVSLPFPERSAERLQEGMPARVRRLHRDEPWVPAKLVRLGPSVNGSGATAVIEFDPPDAWPSGALLEGEVQTDRRENAVLTPSESVVSRPERRVVYVLPGDAETGQVEEREVDIGYRSHERTEILLGVSAGERVVVDGAQYLSDGSEVRAREANQ